MDRRRTVVQRSRRPLTIYGIGVDLKDDANLFCVRTGLENDDAILVRPDGFIGWKTRTSYVDPTSMLDAALSRMLCLEVGAG